MSLTYAPSTPDDAYEMVLRAEDAAEVALWGVGPALSLAESISGSTSAHTARDAEGRVVSIFGLARGDGVIHPWMLSSDLVEAHPVTAIRMGRELVKLLHEAQPLACNWVGKEAHRNRAFIKSLGFVIVPTPGSPFDFFFLPKDVP